MNRRLTVLLLPPSICFFLYKKIVTLQVHKKKKMQKTMKSKKTKQKETKENEAEQTCCF